MLNVWLFWPHVLGPAPPQLVFPVQGRIDRSPLHEQISLPTTISLPFLHLPTCHSNPLHEKLWLVHVVDLHLEKLSVIFLAVVRSVQL